MFLGAKLLSIYYIYNRFNMAFSIPYLWYDIIPRIWYNNFLIPWVLYFICLQIFM